MILITEIRDADRNIVFNLDGVETDHLVIQGNRLEVWGNGEIVARGRLELDHNVPVWRIFRGARGREVGIAQEVSVGI